MPIRVVCPACSKGIKAPSKYAGKEARCPGCGGKIEIPAIKKQNVTLPGPGRPARSGELIPASVSCPFCSEPILPQAKKCKHCGEFLDESARPTSAAPSDPTPLAVANTAQTPGPSKEQDLLLVRPKFFRNEPASISLLVCLGLLGTGVAGAGDMAWVWSIPAFVTAVLVIKFLKCLTTSLKITTKRSVLRLGILSKRTREVRHSDVRLLQVDQSFFQRLMGVGSISLASAGHGEVEIKVGGIRNPNHIKETIDGYRG